MEFEEIQAGIDEMGKAFESDFDGEVELELGDSDGTNAPGTSAPGTEVPAPSTEVPNEPEDPRDVRMKELEAEIEKLKNPKPPSTDAPSTEAPVEEVDFLGDVKIEDLNEENLNKILNSVYKQGLESGKKFSKQELEQVKNSIPEIAQNAKAVRDELESINKKFYEDNPELTQWKTAVGTVFDEISGANPGKHYKEILPLVAEETRKRLGIKKGEGKKPNDLPPPPKSGKHGTRGKPSHQQKSKFDEDLDAMNKALEL